MEEDLFLCCFRFTNRSLSRVASEALGLFDERAGYDKKARRRLGRALQASGDARLYASGDVFLPEERLPFAAALWLYTVGAAFACDSETKLGNLAPKYQV